MKSYFYTLCMLIQFFFISAQELDKSSLIVRYHTVMVKDTIRNKSYSDDLKLLIGSSYSLYSSEKWENLATKYKELTLQTNPLNILVLNGGTRNLVLNDFKESKFHILEPLKLSNYSYIQPNNLIWKIEDSQKTIIGYSCQRAVTDYGGRQWIAWFTPDIAISEGPWVFKGLPGLILEVEDAQNYFKFSAIGIEKKEVPIVFSENGYTLVTKAKVMEILKSYQYDFIRTTGSYLNNPELLKNLTAEQVENFKSGMLQNFIEKKY